MKKKWFTRATLLLLLVGAGCYTKEKQSAKPPTAKTGAVPTPAPTSVATRPATALPATHPAASPGPFPVRFPLPTARLYMRNKRYRNGVDSTVRVRGDQELCEALHHVPVPSGDCHFESDVWQYESQKAEYEMAIMGGCPVWEYRTDDGSARCHNDQNAQHSCDHFGSVGKRDDPKTPEFEGWPALCGNQSDEFGPYAGFFMIPQHGEGPMFVRACLPGHEGDNETCGPWIEVDWR
jgi:hypothetical protein